MKAANNLAATVATIIDVGNNARRLADELRRHERGAADPLVRAGLHRLELVLRETATTITLTENGLSPATRAAIAAQ